MLDLRASRLLALPFCFLTACIDQPVCVTPPGSSQPAGKLSQLGLFVGGGASQEPAPGVFAYTVNASLYADLASKHRFIVPPPGQLIHPTEDRWELPVGTLLVKTFSYLVDMRNPGLGERLVETRVMMKTATGMLEGTYVWNEAQTDAICSPGNLQVPTRWIDTQGVQHDDSFHVPGTSQCSSCHGQLALGVRTRQLNVAGTWPDGTTNQIDHLAAMGAIDDLPPAPWQQLVNPMGSEPVEARARSYLDANCSHCHNPDGRAGETGLFLTWENEDPQSLGIGVRGGAVDGASIRIDPGNPDGSIVIARMRSDNLETRMPRGPTHIPDTPGIGLVSEWIREMEAMP